MTTPIVIENTYFDLHGEPDICPLCHRNIVTDLLSAHRTGLAQIQAVYQCPNSLCRQLFIGVYPKSSTTHRYALQSLKPKSAREADLPSEIKELSPSFEKIYSQAIQAEASGLDEIAGTGYRKSLEFIIKDFCISRVPEREDQIKNKFLGNVINEDIDSPQLKAVAKKATWLGNDESHYVKKFESEDLTAMKRFISAVIHWVEMELITDKELRDQSE